MTIKDYFATTTRQMATMAATTTRRTMMAATTTRRAMMTLLVILLTTATTAWADTVTLTAESGASSRASRRQRDCISIMVKRESSNSQTAL